MICSIRARALSSAFVGSVRLSSSVAAARRCNVGPLAVARPRRSALSLVPPTAVPRNAQPVLPQWNPRIASLDWTTATINERACWDAGTSLLCTPLQLDKPLIALDLETTPFRNGSNRIWEVACLKVHRDQRIELLHELINPDVAFNSRLPETSPLRCEPFTSRPTFAEVAPRLGTFLRNCYLTGYNIRGFDAPTLRREFARVQVDVDLPNDLLIDALQLFRQQEPQVKPKSLSDAYRFYANKTMPHAHRASCDAAATLEVLLAQIRRYGWPQQFPLLTERLSSASKQRLVRRAGNKIPQSGISQAPRNNPGEL